MCKDCGCSITNREDTYSSGTSSEHQGAHQHLHDNPQLNDKKTIDIITKILDKNDHEAEHNRIHTAVWWHRNMLGMAVWPDCGRTSY